MFEVSFPPPYPPVSHADWSPAMFQVLPKFLLFKIGSANLIACRNSNFRGAYSSKFWYHYIQKNCSTMPDTENSPKKMRKDERLVWVDLEVRYWC